MKTRVSMFMTLLISVLSAGSLWRQGSSVPNHSQQLGNESISIRDIKDPFAGVSEGFSKLDGYIYDGGLAALPATPQTLGDRITDFIIVLRSYIHDSVFEFAEFRLSVDILKERLVKIQRQANSESPWDKEAAAQLMFADYMLRVMESSSELLKFYSHDGGVAQRLIHKTIQLNVKLLTLFNSYGTPNPKVPNFQETVTRLFHNLNAWGTIILNLENVTVSLLLAFHTQYTHAKDTIRDLASSMPGQLGEKEVL